MKATEKHPFYGGFVDCERVWVGDTTNLGLGFHEGPYGEIVALTFRGRLYELRDAQDPDQPDEPDDNMGPEIDDEGGMSEWRSEVLGDPDPFPGDE